MHFMICSTDLKKEKTMQEPNDVVKELQLMNTLLEDIAISLNKFVMEGITIYQHISGDEERN